MPRKPRSAGSRRSSPRERLGTSCSDQWPNRSPLCSTRAPRQSAASIWRPMRARCSADGQMKALTSRRAVRARRCHASAEVFRTGRPARTEGGYASRSDPITAMMSTLRSKDGVAAPITVAGKPWGALGAAYRENLIPADVEVRLLRFASLVGLAISNADAWDRLERQASTDPLTGIANRRTFRGRGSRGHSVRPAPQRP